MRPLFVALSLLVTATSARAACKELVDSGRVHESANEREAALRNYSDAASIDPLCEGAWVGMGRVRAALGDLREADRIYTTALDHLPSSRELITLRAGVRWKLGQTVDAEHDILMLADDPNVLPAESLYALESLAGWYGESNRAPAQLATWRRILAIAAQLNDAERHRKATVMVRALQRFLGPADPVTSPPIQVSRIARVRVSIANAASKQNSQ